MAQPGHLDRPVLKDQADHLVQADHSDRWDLMVLVDLDLEAQQVHAGLKDPVGLKDRADLTDQPALAGRLVKAGPGDQVDLKDRAAPLAQVDQPAQADQVDPLDC